MLAIYPNLDLLGILVCPDLHNPIAWFMLDFERLTGQVFHPLVLEFLFLTIKGKYGIAKPKF